VIGFTLTLFGLVAGSLLSVLVGRLMGSLIYGVDAFDPWTMVFLVGIMALFSAVASFVPAAKIGRSDPAEILREG
jgi:ABC-type antimicrobial peptide transport system permease subunit